MSLNYRTDADRSALKPAGPYLIERSADPAAQSVTRGCVTVGGAYTAVVATIIRPISIAPKSGRSTASI